MPTTVSTVEIPPVRRRAFFDSSTYDSENHTVEVVWTTGAESVEFDPFPGPFLESLSFEPGACDLGRLNSGTAPAMKDHSRVLDGQVGVIDSAWITTAATTAGDSEGRALIRLSQRDELKGLRQDIRQGIVRNCSVSYTVLAYRDVTQPDSAMPEKLAVHWQPFEISFVPVGHDAGARTRSAETLLNPCTIESHNEAQTMTNKTPSGAPAQVPAPVVSAGTANPVQIERQRGIDIRQLVATANLSPEFADSLILLQEDGQPITTDRARALALVEAGTARQAAGTPAPAQTTPVVDSAAAAVAERSRGMEVRKAVTLAGLPMTYADELVAMNAADGSPLSADRCRSLIFDRLAQETNETPANGGHVQVVSEGIDRARAGIANALEVRCGIVGEDGKPVQLTQHGRAFHGMRICRVAEEFFTVAGMGEHVRGQNPDQVARFALVRSRSISGGHGTTDFSSLLANVADKKLRTAYNASPSTYRSISSRSEASDFKDMSRVQLGEYPTLTKVLPGAEYEMGTIGESGETYAIAKYGKRIAFTREAMINDDLSSFNRLPMLAGRSSSELESDLAWALITDNAAMSDGVALFHANHGNLGTGVPSVATIGAGRTLMRKQTGINGQRIGVRPEILIVPAALETVGLQATAAITPATLSNVNPWNHAFRELVVEPRLDDTSAIVWYMAAGPESIDVLEYAFLMGNDGPTIETREGFEVDGMEMKVRHEFGVAVLDHRGLYKSSGA